MSVTVSVVVWGEPYRSLFLGPVLDSHVDALRNFAGAVRYVVHGEADIAAAVRQRTGLATECRPVIPAGTPHGSLRACQLEVLRAAPPGEVMVLLNADIVVSAECFTAVAAQLARGKKAVLCCGTRTQPGESFPMRECPAAELHAWSMRHRHPVIADAFYGAGRSGVLSTIYFQQEGSVVMRGFHLHPLAVVNDRRLSFTKSTDWNLAEQYPPAAIHVVTDPTEVALAEISPAEKKWPVLAAPFARPDILAWAARYATRFHWWLFAHRIGIAGEVRDCGDAALERSLLRRRSRFAT